MFADYFEVKFGDVKLKGRRLSIKEIRANHAYLFDGRLDVDQCVDLVRSHVTLADGKPFDPFDLSSGQLRELVGELVLPQEGRGISDFIGLLS